MMEYINYACYLFTILGFLLILYSLVIEPIITKQENKKVIQSNGKIRFFKFHYSGFVFFQAATKKQAQNQFNGMKNDQRKILKTYNNKPKKVVDNVKKKQ